MDEAKSELIFIITLATLAYLAEACAKSMYLMKNPEQANIWYQCLAIKQVELPYVEYSVPSSISMPHTLYVCDFLEPELSGSQAR